jgi:hypothetical protein
MSSLCDATSSKVRENPFYTLISSPGCRDAASRKEGPCGADRGRPGQGRPGGGADVGAVPVMGTPWVQGTGVGGAGGLRPQAAVELDLQAVELFQRRHGRML